MKKRFYDHDPTTSQAVELMFKFPSNFQIIIGKGISMIAEREFRAFELLQSYKSLGADKILAMYKTKKKLRHYDNEPILHEAMLYLSLLTPENQVLISLKIIQLVGFMEKYLQICLKNKQPPEAGQAEKLRDTFVQLGEESTINLLGQIEQEFLSQLQSPARPENTQEQIRDAGGNMKIRENRL
jgi:hypothetical protein